MRRVIFASAGLALFLPCLAVFAQHKDKSKTNSSPNQSQETPFGKVVRAHFKSWDLNGDGKLTGEEIDELMVRPRIKGEAAAAVATLRLVQRYAYERYEKPFPPFTLETLKAYEAATPEERQEMGARGGDYDTYFDSLKEKLKNTPRELFPDKVPQITAVKQGYIGDCFFMSMMGALVKMRPEEVVKMIEPGEGNRYKVHFPGVKAPVVIAAPTDAEIALNTSAEKNGLYLTVIEKAYAAHWKRTHPNDAVGKEVNNVIDGGYANVALNILSGHGYLSIGGRDSKKLEDALKAAVDSHCMIYCKMRPKKDVPGMYLPHIYAVTGYDAKTKTVAVFNCIGEDFTPEGKAGIRNGFVEKDGLFTMSYAEFEAIFDGIGYEDKKTAVVEGNKPAKQ